MPRTSPDSSEDARAFLQRRVALYWQVIFFISVLSTAMGAAGALVEPGFDFVVVSLLTVQAGLFWWLCRRGKRSMRFSRWMEAGGLFLNLSGGALLGRYLLASFLSDHGVASPEGALMSDAYVSMMLMGGTGLMVAIRAALIPSAPGLTALVSGAIGVPMVLATAFMTPLAEGGLALRPPEHLWLPGTAAMMWGFVILTCTVISWVIYGLQREVREARRFGQYVLEKKLGSGGMGEVYLARHGMMRRPSAVKLLRLDRAGDLDVKRFEREVQLTARLTHPNTITLFDYGRTEDNVFYYAMELLDGANLQRIVEVSGPQAPERVVRILSMACGALTEAHGIGLIHRDIKPANIMLCRQGGEYDVVKVLDFGLVKELASSPEPKLTGAATVTGSPQYMAPESIRDPDSVDVRTDIYALGTVAYYLLAGVDVFDGKSVVEICGQHLHELPKPISRPGLLIPAKLEAVVLACLEKDPARRPQSATELRERIAACDIEPWDSARAQRWWQEHPVTVEDNAPQESWTIAVARRS